MLMFTLNMVGLRARPSLSLALVRGFQPRAQLGNQIPVTLKNS